MTKDPLIRWLKRRPVRVLPYDHVFIIPAFISRKKLGSGKRLAYGWQVDIPVNNELGVKVSKAFPDDPINDQQSSLVAAEAYLAERIAESPIITEFIKSSNRYLIKPKQDERWPVAPGVKRRGRPVGSVNRKPGPQLLENQVIMQEVANQVLMDNGKPVVTTKRAATTKPAVTHKPDPQVTQDKRGGERNGVVDPKNKAGWMSGIAKATKRLFRKP